MEALEAIIKFAANSNEVQHCQQQQGAALGREAAGQAEAATTVDLQDLAACLLPQLDVVELLQHVLNSFGPSSPQQQDSALSKPRTLPFLGYSSSHGAAPQLLQG